MPTNFQVTLGSKDEFDEIKQKLISEAKETGDESAFVFDEQNLRVDVGCGFKELMDRFPKGRDLLKAGAGLADDKRPYQDLFRDELATPEVKKAYAERENNVLKKLRDEPYQQPTNPVKVDDNATPKDATLSVLSGQPGLVLADDHSQADSKDLLTDNMDDIAGSGVTNLFIEHFWQEQQEELDAYINGGANDPLPPCLAKAVEKLDAGMKGKQSFAKMLAAAKRKKVRIVALDSFENKVAQDNDPRLWERRAARFNEAAAEIIRKEKGTGKFMVMAGKKHNNTHEGGIPGLGQLLGIQAFELTGGKLEADEEKKELRGMRSGAQQMFLDTFIDKIRAEQPGLFDASNTNAKINQSVIMETANKLVANYGNGLDNLDPAKLKQVALDSAGRAAAKLKDGTIVPRGNTYGDALLAAADEKSDEYKKALGEMKNAARQGPAQYNEFKKSFAKVNDSRVLMETFEFKQGLIVVGGAGPLHLAAMCGDDAELDEVLKLGGRADGKDAKGNTPLHALGFAAVAQDNPAIAAKLLAKGASLTQLNSTGQTPVHLAAFGNKQAVLGELAKDDQGFRTAAAKLDKRGWLAADMATAAGQKNAEDFLFQKGIPAATKLLTTTEENLQPSTVDILVKATKAQSELDEFGVPKDTPDQVEAKVRAYYTKCYQKPEFRSVLDLAAADTLGSRGDTRRALRIYMDFDSEIANSITGKGGYGAFDDRSNTMALGAKRSESDMLGTTVHELTHHAADMVFGNEAVPYNDENSQIAKNYREAIAKDGMNASLYFGGTEKEVAETISMRLKNGYQRARMGDRRKPLLQEYLVGVPQVISDHGLEYAEKVAPNLTKFFKDDFIPSCGTALDNHAAFKRVASNTDLVKNMAPVPKVDATKTAWMTFEHKITGNNERTKAEIEIKGEDDKVATPFSLGAMAMRFDVAKRSTVPTVYPDMPNYTGMTHLPRVYDPVDPVMVPETLELSSANFEVLMSRAMKTIAPDMPPEVSTDFLMKLCEDGAKLLPGFKAANIDDLVGKMSGLARENVRTAKIDYLARAREQGKLTKELVAETLVYEAACKALENDPNRDDRDPAAGPDMNDAKVKELVDSMVKSMSDKQMNLLVDDPTRFRALAETLTKSEKTGSVIKTTQRGFFTKKVKGQEKKVHVSIKVKNTKNRWLRELAKMK